MSGKTPVLKKSWIIFCGFAAIAIFFLWQEHKAHLLGLLPYLLLLMCPFMHLVMHRGHGRHHSAHSNAPNCDKARGSDQLGHKQ